ncbi:MAG: hypothetical protein AAF668_00210 [Pseudomonadota bacterium]
MIADQLIEKANLLSDALNAESAAITAADFDGAASLLKEKMSRLSKFEEAFSAVKPNEIADNRGIKVALEKLMKARKRNETLLEAARDGMLQAQTRVAAIARKSAEVGVYGADGDRLMEADAHRARSQTY